MLSHVESNNVLAKIHSEKSRSGLVYTICRTPKLLRGPKTSLACSRWQLKYSYSIYETFHIPLEMNILIEVADVSIDEDLHLNCKDDGQFYSIVAIVTLMKRGLQRFVGFYEVVAPSYSMDEFRSHNWNFRTENVFTICDFHQFQALLQFLMRITCHLVVVVQLVHVNPD